MEKSSFFGRQSCCITALFKGSSIASLLASARNAQFAGADGIAIELNMLPLEERTLENWRRIFRDVRLPMMCIDYRNDKFLGGDDDARQKDLLVCAEAGAEVIDVMGDLYAPNEFQLTREPEAVARQKALIEQLHVMGTKVVMSSHLSVSRTREQVLEHLQCQAERGADICKIVTFCNTEQEFLESVATMMLLNREMDRPFIYLCSGTYGRMVRMLGPQLGVAIEFAVTGYSAESPLNQPTIQSFKAVMANTHWNINDLKGL